MAEHALDLSTFAAERLLWVTVPDAAPLVQRHRATLYRWIRTGKIAPEQTATDPTGVRLVWLDAVRTLSGRGRYIAPGG